MNAFHRILLVAIAIALMSFAAAPTQAGNVNVRVNRFTPFNVRPDVRVNANGHGHHGNVAVQVNGFHHNGFRSNVFVVPQQQAVFVSPQFIAPVQSFGFQSFGVSGGCFNGSCFNGNGFRVNSFCH